MRVPFRRLRLTPVLSLLLSLVSLTWLAWLSPPSQLIRADSGEPRVAVPVARLTPEVPIRRIRRDIRSIEGELQQLQSGTGSSDLEIQLEELESRVSETEEKLAELCDELYRSGTLLDFYFASC